MAATENLHNSRLMHCNKKLLDHLVGGCEESTWHRKAESLGSFEIYCPFKFDWDLNRKLTGIRAVEHPIDICCGTAK